MTALVRISIALFCASIATSQEPTVEVQLIDNPRLDPEAGGGPAGFVLEDGFEPIPWWRTTAGVAQVRERGFATQGSYVAEQPVAAYAPFGARIAVKAVVFGPGRLVITDGRGERAVLTAEGDSEEWQSIELPELTSLFDNGPIPRLNVTLESQSETQPAIWRSVELFVSLPCPSEADLRAEILAELRWIFDLWLELGMDREGARATGYLAGRHDVLTGERTAWMPGGPQVFFELLRDALEVEEVPAWRAAWEHFLEDWLELGFHPTTGLPVGWDCAKDRALIESPREIHAAMGLLVDVAESGPERFRERAEERARVIAEHVVARGALPDGTVAPGYRPRDGEPHVSYIALRRLDVPAQLARVGALVGGEQGERFVAVAREAVLAFEYTNSWPGDWDAIDPGWDDQFGHYGARSTSMWKARPDVDAFVRVARDGFLHYAPIWRDALRFGGNLAADQVRCWEILRELARLDPELRPEVASLLGAAIRAQFKGEQYADGAWGDVTIYRFDPKDNLQVGDLPGVPQNLLFGLALCYDRELGLRTDATRGMFTAVMRSTIEHYRRTHGYLSSHGEQAGGNPGGGSVRFAVGLVEMLRQLSRSE